MRHGLIIAISLFLLAQATHAQEGQRCQLKGKEVITNLSCEQLAHEAGIAKPATPRHKAAAPDTPAQSAGSLSPAALVEPPQGTSVGALLETLPISVVNKPLPSIIGVGLILLFVVWILFAAKRALGRFFSFLTGGDPAGSGADEILPYRRGRIMSPYEEDLFWRLRAALPECEIFPQAPLASFIEIDRQRAGDRYFSNSYRWQQRISQQRVDFLVCDGEDLSVVAAIELDDPTHGSADAMARDAKKNKSLRDAHIPLIRWRVEAMPDQQKIRQTFMRSGWLN